jgi:hypothetical protein
MHGMRVSAQKSTDRTALSGRWAESLGTSPIFETPRGGNRAENLSFLKKIRF